MIASLTAVGSRGEDLDPARFRRLIPAASGSTDNGVSTLTISNAELVPVPEPAIWLTALAGLGLLARLSHLGASRERGVPRPRRIAAA